MEENFVLSREDIKMVTTFIMAKVCLASMTKDNDSVSPDALHPAVLDYVENKLHQAS